MRQVYTSDLFGFRVKRKICLPVSRFEIAHIRHKFLLPINLSLSFNLLTISENLKLIGYRKRPKYEKLCQLMYFYDQH